MSHQVVRVSLGAAAFVLSLTLDLLASFIHYSLSTCSVPRGVPEAQHLSSHKRGRSCRS